MGQECFLWGAPDVIGVSCDTELLVTTTWVLPVGNAEIQLTTGGSIIRLVRIKSLSKVNECYVSPSIHMNIKMKVRNEFE